MKKVLFLACVATAALARGATPPPATETLDEIGVTSVKDRERQRGPVRDIRPVYRIAVQRDGVALIELAYMSATRMPQKNVRFRRTSGARRLTPMRAPPQVLVSDAVLSSDQLVAVRDSLTKVYFTLDANIDEADGLPASIPFGPRASLVNLDYVRLLTDQDDQTGITVINAIYPQTRRCEERFALLDEGQHSPNRFVLIADTYGDCRRAERGREGDLLFADGVPEGLRQAVRDAYEPIATRLANRLGSEPGQVFVAWWPDSPHEGFRFERSWNRNNLLLFNGSGWRQGLDPQQREALREMFIAEQVQRRIRQSDWPGAFTQSATRYLQALYTAEQARNTSGWLTDALPAWIAACASDMEDRAGTIAAGSDVTNVECGLVVQFVYDAVARAKSRGRENLYDTWRQLLSASFRRGESGAKPPAFLASSEEAHRIVRGLLDGGVDWGRFTAELERIGVRLRVDQDAPEIAVQIVSLANFDD